VFKWPPSASWHSWRRWATHKRPPKLLLLQLHKTVQFLVAAFQVLLALCCTPCPSSSPTRKSQVGLHLVIVGGTQQILCILSIGREKCCQDRPWHHYGNVGVPRLVDTTCPHLHTGAMDSWNTLRFAAPVTVPSENGPTTPLDDTRPQTEIPGKFIALWTWTFGSSDDQVHCTIQLKCRLISPNSCSLLSTGPQIWRWSFKHLH